MQTRLQIHAQQYVWPLQLNVHRMSRLQMEHARYVSGMIRHMFIDTCTEKTIITGSCEAIRLCTKKTQHEQCDAEINIYSNETPEMLNVQHNTICRNTINMALVNISTG